MKRIFSKKNPIPDEKKLPALLDEKSEEERLKSISVQKVKVREEKLRQQKVKKKDIDIVGEELHF